MKIGKRTGGVLAAVFFLVGAQPLSASYVLYYRVIDDWTVLCGEESPGQDRSCSLSAPPPVLDDLGARNEIIVEETSADVFRVAVAVREVAPSGTAVTVRIDGFPAHEAFLAAGRATWSGPEATLIIREGLAGQFLVAGVETDAGIRETRVSLIGFSKAIETYRRVVRSHGAL